MNIFNILFILQIFSYFTNSLTMSYFHHIHRLNLLSSRNSTQLISRKKFSTIDNIIPKKQTKYIVVTGGVISGLGKGITASSVGILMKLLHLNPTAIKIDPYLNIDAGTMSPFEHGETVSKESLHSTFPSHEFIYLPSQVTLFLVLISYLSFIVCLRRW